LSVNDEWGIFKTHWKDSNQIGERSKRFLDEHATWVIYLRRNLDIVCPEHFDSASNSTLSFDSWCPTCLGLGYVSTATIVPGRFDWTLNKRNIKDSDNKLPAGQTSYNHAALTFSRIVRPKLEDIIIIPEYSGVHSQVPHDRRIRPIGVTSLYAIKTTAPYFERDLDFIHCGLEIMTFKREWAEDLINNFKILPILKEDKLWDRSYW
jgi:hypothetical protein